MESHQPAVPAHRGDHLAALSGSESLVVSDELKKEMKSERREIPTACIAGFRRTYPIKRRFVPLPISRLLCRFR